MLFIILICFLVFSCNKDNSTQDTTIKKTISRSDSIKVKSSNNIPSGLQKLIKAFPNFLDSANANYLYWKDGTKMQYDDGIKDKDYETVLNNPDLKDQMSQTYKKGPDWETPPAKNFEPGRIRYEPFFKKMYGNSSSEVKQKLVNINWIDGIQIEFTTINGAADSLRKIVSELKQLGIEYQKYLINIGGTFNWRNIAGTTRLSNL